MTFPELGRLPFLHEVPAMGENLLRQRQEAQGHENGGQSCEAGNITYR